MGGAGGKHGCWYRRSGAASIALPLIAGITLFTLPFRAVWAQSIEDLQKLSLEQLGNVSITSVSRRPEKLSDAAAAVYVITAEDIRRSGYIRMADVLRLAPNLEVQQVNGQTYAVSARGFDSVVDANKLLVMVDGRQSLRRSIPRRSGTNCRFHSTTSNGSK